MATLIDNLSLRADQSARVSKPIPRILCIDDDPDVHATLEMRLRRFEVQVEHAYFGMQAVAEVVKQRPHLIITDLSMPNGDGEYLIESIRNHHQTSAIPIIVLTGRREASLKAKMLGLGADVFLQKPAKPSELLDYVGSFVELSSRN